MPVILNDFSALVGKTGKKQDGQGTIMVIPTLSLSLPITYAFTFLIIYVFVSTSSSKASDKKRSVIASFSDDAVMHAIHHLADNCLQFQL